MKGSVKNATLSALAILSISCSGTITDPKKMIEIAANDDDPRSRLNQLYRASVLPEPDNTMSWVMAQEFSQQGLQHNRKGFQADTADFPSTLDIEIDNDNGIIETATGKLLREYRIYGYLHANNRYGARTRLKLTIRLRTPDNQKWKTYKLYISDPSDPNPFSYVFKHEEDQWDGYSLLQVPDSLYTQLEAYMKEHEKQN